MNLTLPRVRQMPTPNYSHALIKHDLLVAHRTEGGYDGSCAWLCDLRAGASAQAVLKATGEEITQLVPMSMKAWHACAFNSRGPGIEIEGFTATGFSGAVADNAARVFGLLAAAYDVPPVWAKGGEGRGLVQHHDLGAAGGGHVDCSAVGSADWLAFVALVKQYRDAFAALPALPEFLLHGLPNPHTTAPPPSVPAEPSHGGAARHEPGDDVEHPTASRYPDGSVADLQWRLDKAGAAPPILVDGVFGPQTRAAVAAFQGKHGCYVDGVPGPQTWRALREATA